MFNMILATRSYAQLRLLFHEYERLTGHAFEKAIEREFSGDVESAMLAVGKLFVKSNCWAILENGVLKLMLSYQ